MAQVHSSNTAVASPQAIGRHAVPAGRFFFREGICDIYGPARSGVNAGVPKYVGLRIFRSYNFNKRTDPVPIAGCRRRLGMKIMDPIYWLLPPVALAHKQMARNGRGPKPSRDKRRSADRSQQQPLHDQ
jgi:hypothetical protein